MSEEKKSICKDHNEQFGFHSVSNDGTKCYVCDLETRLNTLALIFKDVTLGDIQKLTPEIKESSFNDFKSLLAGEH